MISNSLGNLFKEGIRHPNGYRHLALSLSGNSKVVSEFVPAIEVANFPKPKLVDGDQIEVYTPLY